MGYYPALNISAQYNNKDPHMWKRKAERPRVSERFENATLMALKIEEEATGQGIQEVSRSWKGNERDFHLQSPEGTQPRQCLYFSLVKPILEFWPLKM